MNKQTDVLHIRLKVAISLHDRSNEKMPDLFWISWTVEALDAKAVAAVVELEISAECMQKAVPSFDI